jgi:N-acyl-D-aspartate/D-glutamate deacylase
MLDFKIAGGDIVDGTGRPRFRADLGVQDGRIAAIGDLSDRAARQMYDASGRIVAPGFIDAHTHYDAQVFWDPKLSPSCFHGVTTIVGGFCGFSIAPITAETAAYIRPMLARVEGMPLATLEAGAGWDWGSFDDYLSRLEGRIGLNAGFFCGHSTIRRMVMGSRAVGEAATPDEIARMEALLDRCLAEGALGFSTTLSPTHNDGDGDPVPSRWADRAEMLRLAAVVGRHEGAGLEMLPGGFDDEMQALLADVSIAAQRPLNWNMITVTGRPDIETAVAHQLGLSDHARARGGEVIALTLPAPPDIFLNLQSGFNFDALPGAWREVFKWPLDRRITGFRDPELRRRLAEGLAQVTGGLEVISRIEDYEVAIVVSAANESYVGRRIDEIARTEGRAEIDVFLDIAVEDGLATIFRTSLGGADQKGYELRGRLWADDRVLIGASDAGAHLDVLDAFAFSSDLLQKGVREYGVIGLEAAVHRITQRPATYFGLVDRGVLAQGAHADIVVFDEARVGRGPTYRRHDLPGGGGYRLYAEAEGIDRVFVNGAPIVEAGVHTGRLPGAVLRSGRDTRTTAMDAMRTLAS